MLLLAAAYALGFLGSMPVVGPVSAVVLSRGLGGQAKSGQLIAYGAGLAEGTWAGLAAYGAGELIAGKLGGLTWAKPVGGIILIAVGLRLYLSKASGPTKPRASSKSFVLGLSLAGLNPGLLVTWSGAIAGLYTTGLVTASPALAVPFGLFACLGIVSWYSILLALLRRHRDKAPERVVMGVIRGLGAVLVVLGLGTTGYFVAAMVY